MNDFLQPTRSDPLQSIVQAIKPALRKDLTPAASFASVLDTQYTKDKPKADDDPKPSSDDRDREDKQAETACEQAAQTAPIGGTPTPPPQPVQPHPEAGKGQPAPGTPGGMTAAAPVGLSAAGAAKGTATAPIALNPADVLAGAIQAAAALPKGAAKAAQTPLAGAEVGKALQKDTLQLSSNLPGGAAAAVPASVTPSGAQDPAAGKHANPNDLPVPVAVQQVSQAKAKTIDPAGAVKTSLEPNTAPPPAASQVQPAAVDPASVRAAQPALEGVHLATAASTVFEPARLTEAQTNNLIMQVSNNVEALARSRQNTLHLMLNPEELGRIDLRLSTSNGGTTVSIIAQQSGTSQLLESQVNQLRQALDQAGIHLTNLSVGQQNNQASSGQNGQRQHGQGAPRQSSLTIESTGEDRMALSNLASSEGFDYRV